MRSVVGRISTGSGAGSPPAGGEVGLGGAEVARVNKIFDLDKNGQITAGEFVGIIFDGNIQSLPTRFVYDDRISRSVMVDARGIIEALLKIYDAKPLVDEILGRK